MAGMEAKEQMNTTLEYIIKKFNVDVTVRVPVEIGNVNRTMLAQTLGELGFKTGAEIGVAQGKHAAVLCEANPGVKLYCVDVWDLYDGYNEYRNRIRYYHQEARRRLKPHDVTFVKKFSMEALDDFADESLDFVYIDSAHDFKSVANDICEWTKKVRVGGIVFGHDYYNSIDVHGKYPVDVKSVVQAYTYTHNITPWFVLKNDIPDPVFNVETPGWLFVRRENDRL